MSDEVNITVHIAPNASPETLQALSDMMKCLIKAVEEGTIGIDQGKPGSDVAVLAEIKDGKIIKKHEIPQSAHLTGQEDSPNNGDIAAVLGPIVRAVKKLPRK